MKKSDPRFADPFNTDEFKQTQEHVAERLGIDGEQLAKLQKEATPEKWRSMFQ